MINNSTLKRSLYFICLLISFTCVLMFSGCANNGTAQQEDESKKVGEEQQTKQSKDKVYKIGDIIQVKDSKLTVNEVTKSSGSEYDKPKSGYEFVIVKITLENIGNSPISYNPYDFKMQNSQGQITEQAFTTVDQDTALQSGELAPGGKITGTIPFEQPVNDPSLQLQYSPDYFSDELIKIDLQ